MGQTKIEWTGRTWNPVTGCAPISPGCEHCYARRMATRLAGRFGYPKEDPFAVTLHTDRLEGPFQWKTPQLIFPCSMGDLFHEDAIDQGYTSQVFDVMTAPQCSHHTFQILTKRIASAFRWWYDNLRYLPHAPLSKIWWGVTAENQEWADQRIPILLQIPAAVRFVSLEPLLGAVNMARAIQSVYPTYGSMVGAGKVFHDNDEFDRKRGKSLISWVIVGCESGPKRRPCDTRWIADIVAQCHAALVPVWVKQIQVKGKVVKDPNTISNQIGYPVDDIRQWPRTR